MSTIEEVFRAIERDDVAAVRKFIEARPRDIDELYEGRTCLAIACAGGRDLIISDLIHAGACVNGKQSCTTMVITPYDSFDAHERALMSERACARMYYSPIANACAFNRMNAVRMLVAGGADVNACDAQGITPLEIACEGGFYEIEDILIRAGARIKFDGPLGIRHEELIEACKMGDAYKVESLIGESSRILARCQRALTAESLCPAFIAACKRNSNPCVRILLGKGADPNLAMQKKKPPIYYAYKHFDYDTVWLLIERGADVNVRLRGGKTLLIFGCANRRNIDCLVGYPQIDLDAFDKRGRNALFFACKKRGYSNVEALLKRGASIASIPISKLPWKQRSVLCRACASSSGLIVRSLIEGGIDVNAPEHARALFRGARRYSILDCAKELFEGGFRITCHNFKEMVRTVLVQPDTRLLEMFASRMNINYSFECLLGESTLLFEACCLGRVDIVKTLIALGANIGLVLSRYEHGPGSEMQTDAFVGACMFNQHKIIRLFLRAGVSANGPNSFIPSPLELAIQREGDENLVTARILLRGGAHFPEKNQFLGFGCANERRARKICAMIIEESALLRGLHCAESPVSLLRGFPNIFGFIAFHACIPPWLSPCAEPTLF